MRIVISFAIVSLFALTATAVVPFQLTHQGRLLDSSDQPLTGTQTVTFTLWEEATGDFVLWTDDLSVTFDDGYYNVILGGSTNPIDENVLDDSDEVWMSLTIGAEELLPRQRAVSVPYAVMAETAELASTLGGMSPTDIMSGTISTLGSNPVELAAGSTVDGQAIPTGATLGGLSCNPDDVAFWNGGSWNCLPIESIDTDTHVTSVDGLAGGTISSDVWVSGNLSSNQTVAGNDIIATFGDVSGHNLTATGEVTAQGVSIIASAACAALNTAFDYGRAYRVDTVTSCSDFCAGTTAPICVRGLLINGITSAQYACDYVPGAGYTQATHCCCR